ncbi:hypothetical protein ACVWYU_001723 [Pseudomonas sp. TE12234]
MDALTRLLLEKYQPDSPRLLEPTVMEVQKAASKKVMTVVMSSDDYDEAVIMKALIEFNSQHRDLISSSYTLPADMLGIPAGSWVLVTEGVSIE